MKKITLLLALLLLSIVLVAQHDDRPYLFNRNSITAGFGYHASGPATLYAKNFEFEYERYLNKFFAVSGVYKYMKNGSFGRQMFSNEFHSNAHFYPFTNLRKHLFIIGMGLNYSQNTTLYEKVYFNENYSSKFKSVQQDYGLNAFTEYRINVTKNINLGIKAYSQANYDDQLEFGWIIKAGCRF